MKKRFWASVVPALCLTLLFGCAAAALQEEEGPVLWFAGDTEAWTDTTTAVVSVPYGGELSVPALMEGLLNGPGEAEGALPTIPAGTELLDWDVDNSGLLRLDLSGEYAGLEGLELTLADYCITMTMEQLPGVEQVSLTVEGEPLSGRGHTRLSSEQVILTGAEEQPVEMVAVLYFPRFGGRGLGIEHRTFLVTEDDVLVEVVTRALLEGPESSGLTTLIPAGTQLLSARLEDGVCRVDLSHHFTGAIPESEDDQTLVLYSIADTLGNLDQVESVVLRVEGEELARYGQVDFGGVLEPDFGLVGSH